MVQRHSDGDKGSGQKLTGKPHSATPAHGMHHNESGMHHNELAHGMHHNEWFSRFAHETAKLAGKPATFGVALAVVVIWGLSGPVFAYSDTWQLVINTSTTIVTFLMVFLIQNTQNRDTMALQVKLAELIIAVQGAKNRLATAEDLSEEELERLHHEYCQKADATRETLEQRRARKATA